MIVQQLMRSGLVMIAVLVLVVTLACGGGGDGRSSSAGPPLAPSPVVAYSSVDLRVGTGAEAASGRRVTVHYAGWLYDANQASRKGALFQTTVGGSPFAFVLGTGQVIRGWDQGVPGMRVGGLRQLILPPELAYGATGAGGGVIPPNAALVFEIELLDVQ